MGRGEPFTVLTDDRAIARAHFVVLLKKSKLYIKDLKSQTGTIHNGVKIKPSKTIYIENGGEVKIGSQVVEVFTNQPEGNLITVSRASFDTGSDLIGLFGKCFGGAALLILFFTLSSPPEDRSVFDFSYILLCICMSIFMSVIFFIGAFFGTLLTRAYRPEDIFIGIDGFTVHFSDGTNMTFKNSDIDSWDERGRFLTIFMKGSHHKILKDKSLAPVLEHLKKNVKNGQKGSHLLIYVLIGLVAIATFCLDDYPQITWVLAALFLTVHLKKKWRTKIYGEPQKMGTLTKKDKKVQWKFAAAALAYGAFALYSEIEMAKEQKFEMANVKSCLAGDQNACKKFNRFALPHEFVVPEAVTAKACELKNVLGCPANHRRAPAQEKPK